MTKIMLVEDDNNLREIYEARLAAEGYDIVAAQDGEAALAVAAKEHPDLVITDVMMPKISGFEMLDILRNTETLRDVKVIMLTALGQAEDNARAGALGADRYLVKSQVTLEDIVKATHDVLEGTGADIPTPAAPVAAEPVPQVAAVAPVVIAPAEEPQAEAAPEPAAVAVQPVAVVEPAVEPAEMSVAPEPVAVEQVDDQSADEPTQEHEPNTDTAVATEIPAEDVPADNTPEAEVVSEAPEIPGLDAVVQDEPGGPTPIDLPQPVIDVVPSDTQEQIDAAEPAEQAESDMRAQIDQFLDTAADPVAAPPASPTADDTTNDDAAAVALPDLDDSEYDKDESTPDMGVLPINDIQEAPEQPQPDLAVQPEPQAVPEATQPQPVAPAPVAEPVAEPVPAPVAQDPAPTTTPTPGPGPAPAPETEQPAVPPAPPATPGYPSQPYQMPTVPGATVGDQVVSNAINDMISSTGVAPKPSESGVHKKVIAPITDLSKPNINQLLSMEEARQAAGQAAQQSQPQFQQQPQGQPQPQQNWRPGQAWVPPTQPQQPIDPNSISL